MEEKDLSLRIWDLLRDAAVNNEYMMTEFSSRNKLSRLQGRTMLQIFIQEQVRLSDLAEIMGMNPGNLSRVCQTLEDDALLKRERSTEDRRVWAISLTEKGHNVIREVVNSIEGSFKKFLQDHSAEELDQLVRLWTDYNHYFNQARLGHQAVKEKER
jgi:DNA-binding MarR family transcriptional regulator